jgi:hypothetical protein
MITTTSTPVPAAEPTSGLAAGWARTRLVTGRQVAAAVGRGPRRVHAPRSGEAGPAGVTPEAPGSGSVTDLGSATVLGGPDLRGPDLRGRDVGGQDLDDGDGERGMATAEYAIATVAAAGFAGLLVVILRSGEVRDLLMGIIRSALSL